MGFYSRERDLEEIISFQCLAKYLGVIFLLKVKREINGELAKGIASGKSNTTMLTWKQRMFSTGRYSNELS